MMPTDSKTANLNLKVSEDERWAFKELCVKHRMSQVDGFRMAAQLLRAHLDAAEKDAGGLMNSSSG